MSDWDESESFDNGEDLSDGFSVESESEGFFGGISDQLAEDDFGSSGEPLIDLGRPAKTVRFACKSVDFAINGLIKLTDFSLKTIVRATREKLQELKRQLEGKGELVQFEEKPGDDDEIEIEYETPELD